MCTSLMIHTLMISPLLLMPLEQIPFPLQVITSIVKFTFPSLMNLLLHLLSNMMSLSW